MRFRRGVLHCCMVQTCSIYVPCLCIQYSGATLQTMVCNEKLLGLCICKRAATNVGLADLNLIPGHAHILSPLSLGCTRFSLEAGLRARSLSYRSSRPCHPVPSRPISSRPVQHHLVPSLGDPSQLEFVVQNLAEVTDWIANRGCSIPTAFMSSRFRLQ